MEKLVDILLFDDHKDYVDIFTKYSHFKPLPKEILAKYYVGSVSVEYFSKLSLNVISIDTKTFKWYPIFNKNNEIYKYIYKSFINSLKQELIEE